MGTVSCRRFRDGLRLLVSTESDGQIRWWHTNTTKLMEPVESLPIPELSVEDVGPHPQLRAFFEERSRKKHRDH